MNADEIVKALRCEHGHLTNRGRDFMLNYTREEFFKILNESADLIESLQADLRHEEKVSHGQMEQNKRLRRINENLREQLAASQRRERAVVEDIHEMDRFNGKCFRCKSWNGVRCKRGYSVNASFCNDWQWRGPQEAGEGA